MRNVECRTERKEMVQWIILVRGQFAGEAIDCGMWNEECLRHYNLIFSGPNEQQATRNDCRFRSVECGVIWIGPTPRTLILEPLTLNLFVGRDF